MTHSKEKISTESVCEKDLMADLLDKHSKTMVLKVEKVKKTLKIQFQELY